MAMSSFLTFTIRLIWLAFEEVQRKCQIFMVLAVELAADGGVPLLAVGVLHVREAEA